MQIMPVTVNARANDRQCGFHPQTLQVTGGLASIAPCGRLLTHMTWRFTKRFKVQLRRTNEKKPACAAGLYIIGLYVFFPTASCLSFFCDVRAEGPCRPAEHLS
ncbi:protein of unknown function [Desulfovibrio sp. 86]|nr:protein of unknown function [Desulfovibrio sp. 86]